VNVVNPCVFVHFAIFIVLKVVDCIFSLDISQLVVLCLNATRFVLKSSLGIMLFI